MSNQETIKITMPMGKHAIEMQIIEDTQAGPVIQIQDVDDMEMVWIPISHLDRFTNNLFTLADYQRYKQVNGEDDPGQADLPLVTAYTVDGEAIPTNPYLGETIKAVNVATDTGQVTMHLDDESLKEFVLQVIKSNLNVLEPYIREETWNAKPQDRG